jgi:hypothetical protein
MRADAKVLLERLGKSDFRYREFVDRFADLESWPIFEALLKDPRIMPQEELPAMEAAEPGDSTRQPAPRAQPSVQPTAQPRVVPVVNSRRRSSPKLPQPVWPLWSSRTRPEHPLAAATPVRCGRRGDA